MRYNLYIIENNIYSQRTSFNQYDKAIGQARKWLSDEIEAQVVVMRSYTPIKSPSTVPRNGMYLYDNGQWYEETKLEILT